MTPEASSTLPGAEGALDGSAADEGRLAAGAGVLPDRAGRFALAAAEEVVGVALGPRVGERLAGAGRGGVVPAGQGGGAGAAEQWLRARVAAWF